MTIAQNITWCGREYRSILANRLFDWKLLNAMEVNDGGMIVYIRYIHCLQILLLFYLHSVHKNNGKELRLEV